MRKTGALTLLEIILGLPATVLLIPFAMAGATGAAFAAMAILFDRSIPSSARLTMLRVPAEFILWTVGAMVGLSALWLAVLGELDVTHRPRLRLVLILGLLVGIVAALRWLFVMGQSSENYDRATWATWLGLLAGPIVVGTRHLLLLVKPHRAAR